MNPTSNPDFLIKSTLGCSLVINIILLPFFVNALINGHYILAFLICLVGMGCTINIWYGINKKYNQWMNSHILSPVGTIAITYAFFKLGPTGSFWPFVLLFSNYFVLPLKRARLFNILTLLIFLPASWYVLDPSLAARFIAVLTITSLFAYISMSEIYALHTLLEQKAAIDSLTGLFNRLWLKPHLQQIIAQSKRSGMPMTMISIDIDHFKAINDTLGHDKGDEVLEKISSIFKSRTRDSDRAFRVGGEEFLICLHNTNEQDGVKFANDIRQQIERNSLLPDLEVTISIGVSTLQEDMDQSTWLKSCDQKLYRAKNEGRNRVIF